MPILILSLVYFVALTSFGMNCAADRIDNVDSGACKIVEYLTFGALEDFIP